MEFYNFPQFSSIGIIQTWQLYSCTHIVWGANNCHFFFATHRLLNSCFFSGSYNSLQLPTWPFYRYKNILSDLEKWVNVISDNVRYTNNIYESYNTFIIFIEWIYTYIFSLSVVYFVHSMLCSRSCSKFQLFRRNTPLRVSTNRKPRDNVSH